MHGIVNIRFSEEGFEDLQLQQANIEELSEEASEQLIVNDRGKEQEAAAAAAAAAADDDDDDNQADEQILTEIAIPNVNKTVTMAVELTHFIIDIVLLLGRGVR